MIAWHTYNYVQPESLGTDYEKLTMHARKIETFNKESMQNLSMELECNLI